MKITIACVGKIKEKYFVDAIKEYSKRLSRYDKLEIVEVSDEKAPEILSEAQMQIVKNKEGERLMKAIGEAYTIALCIDGKKLSSPDLAKLLSDKRVGGISHICFVIGGSLGLSDEVIKRADYRLSFSDMTFPHQLMRVILLEQIYRAERILANEPYHK